MYYECKARYSKVLENGQEKEVTECHLVEALSFSDAEERFIKEMAPYMNGDYDVSAVSRKKYSEIFEDRSESADKWYKVKLSLITLDEKSGKEKETNRYVLVQAGTVAEAISNLDDGMRETVSDYVIKSVAETNYIDYHKYGRLS